MNQPIKQGARQVNRFLVKNAVPIFTGLTIVGIGGTVYSAVKGAPLAVDIMKEAEEYKGEKLTPVEVVKETWEVMLPTAVWCGLTIGIVITNGRMNWKRQVALSGALSMVDLAFKEYQGKVVETFGKAKADTVKADIVKDRMARDNERDEPTQVVFTGHGDYLCKDNQSGRYFYSTQEAVKRAMNKINGALGLLNEMFIGVNDFYYELGLEPVKYGDIMGWYAENGDISVAFYTEYSTVHHSPCLIIDYDTDEKIPFS